MRSSWAYENWRAHGHRATVHRGECSMCNEGAGVHGGGETRDLWPTCHLLRARYLARAGFYRQPRWPTVCGGSCHTDRQLFVHGSKAAGRCP